MWVADVPGTNHRYVALFNRDSAAGNVSVSLAQLGIGSATVTDLWSGAGLGSVSGTFTRSIPAHGDGLYRLSTQTTVPVPTRHTLTARHSGKCLAVQGAATADGAQATQLTCGTGTNQQWQSRQQ